jgi:2-methylisocitrate lyase-like PEP mutase family enzyme
MSPDADPLPLEVTRRSLVGTLRLLHRPGRPLVLPNVWDVESARAVEAAGFGAVATSSAAIAAELGLADGQVGAGPMLAQVTRIVRAVRVPATADLERGYGLAASELVERLAATGAAGCNLEDSDPLTGELVDAQAQADFLAGVRAAAVDAGVDLVINARIDTVLHGAGSGTRKLADIVRRAQLYLGAGVDCVYPFLLTEPRAIRALVERTPGPVNILCTARVGSIADLATLGVARISFGPALRRLPTGALPRALRTILDGGNPLATAGRRL